MVGSSVRREACVLIKENVVYSTRHSLASRFSPRNQKNELRRNVCSSVLPGDGSPRNVLVGRNGVGNVLRERRPHALPPGSHQTIQPVKQLFRYQSLHIERVPRKAPLLNNIPHPPRAPCTVRQKQQQQQLVSNSTRTIVL